MTTLAARPSAVPLRHVEHCMGTVFSFRVEAPGVERSTLARAVARLHELDALFSTYRVDSQVSAIDAGRLRIADAHPDVRFVLAECDRLGIETGGWFSARADGRHLDPSGYVKGWAIAQAAEILATGGSANHCVNGGGDVVCAGRPDPGRAWRIGIVDPCGGRLLRTVEAIGPLAVATSGCAERGAHIVDPHTGRPAKGLAAVTVVAGDVVTADVLATTAVAMGPERAEAWLAGRDDVSAVLVTTAGRLVETGPMGNGPDRRREGPRHCGETLWGRASDLSRPGLPPSTSTMFAPPPLRTL